MEQVVRGVRSPITVHFLDAGYMVEDGFRRYAVVSINDALSRVHEILLNPSVMNSQGEYLQEAVAFMPHDYVPVPNAILDTMPPSEPQEAPLFTLAPEGQPVDLQGLYANLGAILERAGLLPPSNSAGGSTDGVQLGYAPTPPVPLPPPPPIMPQVPRGDLSDSFTHVRADGTARERHFVLGTGPDVPPPPEVKVPRVNVNHPVIRGELEAVDRLNEAYAVGNVRGQPFKREHWLEGISKYAPNIPPVMAEARLSEYLTRIREDQEDYGENAL